MPQDPYASIAKPLNDDPYASLASPANPVTGRMSSELTDVPTSDYVKLMAKRFAKGAGEGVMNTVSGASELINKIPYIGEKLAPRAGIDAMHKIATPDTLPESVGRGAEQTAEFFIPGPGEAELAAKSGKLASVGKIAYQAAKTGGMNKLQGGDFTTGAIAGGAGEVIGQAAQAIAPKIAESAVGIRKLDKAYGKNPGAAILNETHGFKPEKVAESAKSILRNDINPGIDAMAANYPHPIDLSPAIQSVDSGVAKATARNNGAAIQQLHGVRSNLTREAATGAPIPVQVPASRALDLKRGIRDEYIHNWNPDHMEGTRAAAAQASHAIDTSLDTALGPGFNTLNNRAASLIPVAKRAASTATNAGVAEKVLNRIGRPTGALLSGAVGGEEGYRHGGIPGAVIGGTAGIILPELVASPTGQMIAARTLNAAPKLMPAVKGAAIQVKRSMSEEDEKDRRK